jgi:hypothetical protein
MHSRGEFEGTEWFDPCACVGGKSSVTLSLIEVSYWKRKGWAIHKGPEVWLLTRCPTQ